MRLLWLGTAILSLSFAALAPTAALAWGAEGHQIIAAIAEARLTPEARERLHAILAADTDPLTPHDVMSEAVWADAYRGAGHKETAAWHYADIELQGGTVAQACPESARSAPGQASQGPSNACVVQKIEEFSAELAAPGTDPHERLLALKYLLHFVGDMSQPLHAADNQDHGGNCVLLSLGGPRTVNLHSYWDTVVVQPLGADPAAAAARLAAEITPEDARAWTAGGPRAWLQDSNRVARTSVYTLHSPAGCGGGAPISLPDGYAEAAARIAAVQLEKAGVRLAALLNQDL